MGNAFFNGLYFGQTAQCYIHGHYEGDRHYARYLIPDGYARYQSSNEFDNPIELIATRDGWLIRDDYQLFGYFTKGSLHKLEVIHAVPASRQAELKKLIVMATRRGDE